MRVWGFVKYHTLNTATQTHSVTHLTISKCNAFGAFACIALVSHKSKERTDAPQVHIIPGVPPRIVAQQYV